MHKVQPTACVILLIVCSWFVTDSAAQNPEAQAIRTKARSYRAEHEVTILRELVALLSLPNIASDRSNIGKNADHIVSMLHRRGVQTQRLQVEGSPPVVYGELRAPGAQRTIIIYVHYDGQPVDPAQWATDPWTPVLRDKPLDQGGREIPISSLQAPINGEWRLYARSASDDKSPIIAVLTAIDALRAAQIPLSVNLKFFFEGEEEAGSPHLPSIIQKYSELLKADAWILCDGPVHQTRQMQIYFGARGVTDLEMTVYGPARPLHSGHYGNWAPNPVVLLSHLLSSMRDTDGRILIPGFYDDVRPLTETERRALAEVPSVETEMKHALGLAWSEGSGKPLVEQIMRPALNLRGIHGGHVGAKAQNAVPTEATASIDFRLVPDQTPEKVRSRVEAHIRQQGFFIVYDTPDWETRRNHPKIVKLDWGPGYPPARTSMDLPVSRAVVRAIEEMTGAPIVKMPSLGGSVPMYLFLDVLKTPVIGVPIVNHDNNQHAANENLRLRNLWDGIETFAALLARLGPAWQ
jgi:acetylornithine deacetylase/succinyl-diaminopimelate desuccinylase-like protein